MTRQYYLSKLEYYADFGAVPVMAAAPFFVTETNANMWLSGLLAWTFVEYMLHRYVFHMVYRREHWVHHVNPEAFVGVASHKTTAALLVALVIALQGKLGPFYSGFAFGYWIYIVVHDAIHHPNMLTPWLGSLLRSHETHHRSGVEANFGVTTSLWDHVFMTYARPRRAR